MNLEILTGRFIGEKEVMHNAQIPSSESIFILHSSFVWALFSGILDPPIPGNPIPNLGFLITLAEASTLISPRNDGTWVENSSDSSPFPKEKDGLNLIFSLYKSIHLSFTEGRQSLHKTLGFNHPRSPERSFPLQESQTLREHSTHTCFEN